ncbi:hypothetical protein EZZ75_00785 [Neisseria meningitidis]|nr:hypothetical protein [Neisseria meningitidis]
MYPKRQQSFHRHSRKSGNLETKNYRDLSETTNPPSSFPRRRESGSFGLACFKFRVTSSAPTTPQA